MSSDTAAVSSLAQLPLAVSAIIIGLLSLLYLGYQWALPKPLPGIPYNKAALKSILGDAVEMSEVRKKGGRPRAWLGEQPWRHNSPLVQVFLAPLSKPILILSDYREVQDILLRRGKEFDRGGRNLDALGGVIPNHHIGMKTQSPQFKANRELVKDLMTPNFLHTVSELHKFCFQSFALYSFETHLILGFRSRDPPQHAQVHRPLEAQGGKGPRAAVPGRRGHPRHDL